MEAVKIPVIAIYNKRKELIGIVVRDNNTGKKVFYNCDEKSESDILELFNTQKKENDE